MSTTDTGSTPPAGQSGLNTPQFRVLTQFIKDLSFENPNAPAVLSARGGKPEIGIHVDINARRLNETQFETELRLSVDSKMDGQVQFIIDLLYGGLFLIQGVPQENLEPLLLIECPRVLFPFARRVLADVTVDGGFAPLLIEPIDFTAIYRQQLQRRAQEAGANGAQRAPRASF